MTSFLRNKINLLSTLVNPAEVDNPPKRKVLVIHCHPSSTSFSNAICDHVVDGLKSSGHEVRLKKLYFNGVKEECYGGTTFQPVLTAEEYAAMNNPEVVKDRLAGIVSDKVMNEAVKDLRWSNAIVFIYPTWWSTVPAMLKGYFDRTLVPGVAFTRNDKGLVPNLTNINKIGVVTTFGGSHTVQFLCGDNGRRYFARSFRFLCAPGTNILWHGMHEVPTAKQADREAFLAEVKKAYSKF
jgi:NAD(P)H dehydrogenase (quinone)